jgi:hypothetical protein
VGGTGNEYTKQDEEPENAESLKPGIETIDEGYTP